MDLVQMKFESAIFRAPRLTWGENWTWALWSFWKGLRDYGRKWEMEWLRWNCPF